MQSFSGMHVQTETAELETKARMNAAIGVGTGAIMLLFLILALIYAPTFSAVALIGGLLLVSFVVLILNHRHYITLAGWVFLIGYSVVIIVGMLLDPDAGSPAPYFLGVSVVLSGGLIRPAASFLVATGGVIATGVMVGLAPLPPAVGSIPPWLGPILVPAALLYLLATVSWLYGAETRRMIQNLRRLSLEIREGVNILGSAASEILAATAQVAANAAEMAVSTDETTTTVEEVRQTVQMVNQKAKHVSDSAQKSVQVSHTGKQAVDETVQGMKRIDEQMDSITESIVRLSEQSETIGAIIATVSDLAEQSNLLAVNAAIEAAKAGEQGRGFAVVAREIKSLADQSRQATAQVRTILGDIQKATSAAVMATEQGSKAVEAGVRQSAEADTAIHLLTERIAEAAQAAIQIAASNQQQLAGMEQVAQAMENIRAASSQNASSTKQVEATAQDLHELGQKLKQLVEQFKVYTAVDLNTEAIRSNYSEKIPRFKESEV